MRTSPPAPAQGRLSDADRGLLERAVVLGRRGWGCVHPNPLVGCVIAREGEVLGEGWHEEFGGAHAEVQALERAGVAARGATAYVSLEPCRHEGKTPACTHALLRAGVARVIFGVSDPGPESSGGGVVLRDAGMEVIGPVFGTDVAFRENPAFFHQAWQGTSFVALKLALSLDGRIAGRPGERTALTGSRALREVHRLRAGHDAVLVGARTVLVDDPLLTVRENVPHRTQPARIVLAPAAALSPSAALFDDLPVAPVVVFVRADAPEAALERLRQAGATLHRVRAKGDGLDLGSVLRICHGSGLFSILCEGGGRLASALLPEGLVQRMYLFLAPRVLGDGGVPGFSGGFGAAGGGWALARAPQPLGGDVLLVYDKVQDRIQDGR